MLVMQKTFKKGGPKVTIGKNKLVTINTDKEIVHFYFGNPTYIQAETDWLGRFLWAEYCDSMQAEIKNYILTNI